MVREIIFWRSNFESFYDQQDLNVKRKIDYVLWLVRYTEKVPKKFLKHLEDTDGLYEIRVSTALKEIRILSFFEEQKLIVLINCFIKKSQKTPKKEIELGQKMKREYYDFKSRTQNE
jgi:phage-related protein